MSVTFFTVTSSKGGSCQGVGIWWTRFALSVGGVKTLRHVPHKIFKLSHARFGRGHVLNLSLLWFRLGAIWGCAGLVANYRERCR